MDGSTRPRGRFVETSVMELHDAVVSQEHGPREPATRQAPTPSIAGRQAITNGRDQRRSAAPWFVMAARTS